MHPPKGATDGPVSLKPRDPYFMWTGPDKNIPPEGKDAYQEWVDSMKEDHDEKGNDDQEKGDQDKGDQDKGDQDKDEGKEDKRPTFFITYETM